MRQTGNWWSTRGLNCVALGKLWTSRHQSLSFSYESLPPRTQLTRLQPIIVFIIFWESHSQWIVTCCLYSMNNNACTPEKNPKYYFHRDSVAFIWSAHLHHLKPLKIKLLNNEISTPLRSTKYWSTFLIKTIFWLWHLSIIFTSQR